MEHQYLMVNTPEDKCNILWEVLWHSIQFDIFDQYRILIFPDIYLNYFLNIEKAKCFPVHHENLHLDKCFPMTYYKVHQRKKSTEQSIYEPYNVQQSTLNLICDPYQRL